MRIVRFLYVGCTASALAAWLLLLLSSWHAPTQAFLLWASGRSEFCSLPHAMRGLANFRRYVAGERDWAPRIRVLRSDLDSLSLLATPDGPYWVPSDSSSVMAILLAQQAAGIYGPVLPGEIVLDGGAHVGVYTRRALRAGAKLVVAIEPAPENIECLRRNFPAEIAAGKVILYPKGVWDHEDVLVLHRVAGNSAGDSFVQKYGPGKGVEVPLTTIDKLVAELHLPTVGRIKLDIKGAEKQALRGAASVISRYKPKLAIAAEHEPNEHIEIPNLLTRLNPSYRFGCGSCFLREYRLLPETILAE
jgi:FkbM family methyltransferase